MSIDPAAPDRIDGLERDVERLRHLAERAERDLAESRATGTAGQGAVRVAVDGTGTVRAVEFAEQWYGTASAEEIGAEVLAAVRGAAGESPDPAPEPAVTGIDVLDDLARRLHALRTRLDGARVRAAASSGDVIVVCDGYGTAVEVTVRFTGHRRPAAALLGERIVAVAGSAQKAAAKLRERSHDDARDEALRAAGIPLGSPDPASIVRQAFGVTR